MHLPATLATALERHTAHLQLHTHDGAPLAEAARACGVAEEQLVQGVLLEDHLGTLLAVLPLDRTIDFSLLRRVTGRELQPAGAQTTAHIFPDCAAGALPPVARPYGIGAILDESLLAQSQLWFTPGEPTLLLGMARDDFLALHTKSQQAPFTRAAPQAITSSASRHASDAQSLRPLGNLAERVRTLKQLPPPPLMVTHLLRIRDHATATVDELGAVIGRDPLLCTQLVRHARSGPFHSGRAASLHEVITRVLGFDRALHMALGFAVCHHFHSTASRHDFWHHALLGASLAEALAHAMPAQRDIAPGTAYLAGLLHNIGYRVMGERLLPELELLAEATDAHPELPPTQVEHRLLGIGHTHIGARLMHAWQMPDEVVVCVREHHNELYRGRHAPYVHLMIAVDCLLKGQGIGDSSHGAVPPASLGLLDLDPHYAVALAEQLVAGAGGLDTLARQLCA